MIFTARQLEQLHRSSGSNGQVTLPYRARLTPLAQDWIRQRGIRVGYSDVEVELLNKPQVADAAEAVEPAGQESKRLLWWCDGPCGPAKAALLTVAREANFSAIEVAVDPRRMVEAVKIIAREIKAGRADGGVLLVGSGAAAMVYANRCPSLRAVLGTCLEAVDQGTKLVAANVLVIEHPYKTLPQTRALLARFVKARRVLSQELSGQLSELASCA